MGPLHLPRTDRNSALGHGVSATLRGTSFRCIGEMFCYQVFHSARQVSREALPQALTDSRNPLNGMMNELEAITDQLIGGLLR